ncbi:hypothetical protein MXL79_10830 [Serratia ureilytica]|uniref:hypothetical protein n=1 Tax=Serratia ureilytica TaxID=300181 RepID=UPI002DBAA127|nr:hypothetical protein [Serratia ureilytica]MEB5993650.1 hypothetical protein [Serratia ureilytica]
MTKMIYSLCGEEGRDVASVALYFCKKIKSQPVKSSDLFLSYDDFYKWINCKLPDTSFHVHEETLTSAIQVLCNPKISILVLKYIFIDKCEDVRVNISVSEVTEALRENCFAHPISGELITDYKKYIFPYFSVSDENLQSIEGEI